MELVESQQLLEWLANSYKTFGATLEIITDKSQEGSQFVRGFGGIGGKSCFFGLPLTKINEIEITLTLISILRLFCLIVGWTEIEGKFFSSKFHSIDNY
jgi:hypothetical protein